MGAYLLMHTLSEISSAAITLSQNCPPENYRTKLIIVAAQFVITLTLSLIFLFRPDVIIRMITGPDIGQFEKVDNLWVITGLRMTICFCGLLILFPRIERLFFYIPAIIKGPNILSYMTIEGQSSVIPVKRTVGFLVEIAKLIVAIYLIFGAPHYVRWQMRSVAAKIRGEK
jgi:hypothetical protein